MHVQVIVLCFSQVLGWRQVAVNWQVPGPYSHLKKPAIEQVSFNIVCPHIILSEYNFIGLSFS